MFSGLARIRSWPIIAAARATRSRPGGTSASAAGMPSVNFSPSPKSRPARPSASAGRRSVSETNAVLHDCAKSRANGTAPAAPPSKFLNDRPPTVIVRGQSTTSSGRRPSRRSAAVVTTLKVEPGG